MKTTAFSIYFFTGDESMCPGDKYKLLIEGAKYADRNGFEAVWTPERHFHRFGGLYPNPSVLAASLATITERIAVRAGSIVLPLHHPIRVAEEWAVVDNLSKGRAGCAFASGFHPNDFIFLPDGFAGRRETTWSHIDVVRRLWRGEKLKMRDGGGKEVEIELFPKPVQREMPVWITCANTAETFKRAGSIGANVLTALIGIPLDRLHDHVALYRESLSEHGFDPEAGRVSLMVHTFIGDNMDNVREIVREPFLNYLRSHTQILTSLAQSQSDEFDAKSIPQEDYNELLDLEFARYFYTAGLIGTVDSCYEVVQKIKQAGVNEIGCLLDFGVDVPMVLESLDRLNALRQRVVDQEQHAVLPTHR